ncbi:hypothetical protein [Gordonia sp. DT101]|uniref:hypothetical protein n=1 Tax=Gordonia sp. DT101 TaxID=3416545 RepID=UPI003CF81FBE
MHDHSTIQQTKRRVRFACLCGSMPERRDIVELNAAGVIDDELAELIDFARTHNK